MDVEPHCDDVEKATVNTSVDSPRDEPLQLIEFIRHDTDGNTTIKLIDETMKSLAAKAGSRPLSIICICGPSRQGKSFMLGHMIRCLEALEKEDTDWMDWDNKSKALEGFKFRNGTKPETQGIWVWSRPFIVKNDEDKEIAVLLIDTQGTCDEFTTAKDMSAIVGLSLLISSVMIFNCFNNLQEDILSSMNTYTHYGQLALDQQVEGHPFQKLIFLIRDWNNPGEFQYGSKGGKTFLKEKLQLKPDQPLESQQVRKTIQNCFEDLDCFLMPNIGEKAINLGFTGSVGELAPAFAKKMEEFISSLLSNETLVIKKILGNVVTVAELELYLSTYLEIFNSSEIPSASQMWEANSVVHNNNIVKRSLHKFTEIVKKKLRGNSYLLEEDLDKAAKMGEKQALEIFKKGRKFGVKEKIAEFEEKLEKDIKREKSEFKRQNEEKRNKYIAGATNDAITQYRELMEESISFEEDDPTLFYEEAVVIRSAGQAKDTVFEDFKQKLENESDEKIGVVVKSLEDILESTATSLMNKNKLQRSNAEKLMTTMVAEHTEGFKKTLELFLEDKKFADCEELKTVQDSSTVSTLEAFKKAKKPGKKEFHKDFQEKLEKELGDTSVNMANKHKLHLQQCKANAENSIRSTCEEYDKQLREKSVNVDIEEELQMISDELVAALMEDFLKEGNPYPEDHFLHGLLNDKLKNQLESIYEIVQREVIISQEQMEQSYRNAVEVSVSYYLDEMKDILGSGDCIAKEDLEHEDRRLRREAEMKYEDFEKIGVPDNALDFKVELEERLEHEFVAVKAKNDQNWELAHSKAKNFVKDSHRLYQDSMKPAKDTVRTPEELEKLHLIAFQEAREYFGNNCPAKDDPDFLATYEKEVEEEIEDTYEELKDLFEMKRQEEDMATKSILIDCRKYYHDEMQKHCKNVSFMRPEHLETMHEQAKGAVITRCAKEAPLSDFQKMDLESEMDKLFSKYDNENDMKLNSLKGVAPAIGIDLGTTYCCVAVYYNGKVDIIPNQEQGNAETTASYVAFNPDGSITIGDAAKHNAYQNPENTIYDAKRIIGRKISDPELQKDMKMWPFDVEEVEGIPKININGKYYFPEQISAELLGAFKEMAEKRYKMTPGTITKVVITVPAYFNDGQRQATIDAGELAGFEDITILNEPTAAAMAYSLERIDASPRKVLIFDLGGGTFDVAVLDVEPRNIQVLGVSGDTHLGGEDFDQHLMEHCALVFQEETGVDLMNGKDSANKTERYDARRRLRRLQTECEKAKKMLTSGSVATVSLDAIYSGTDLSVQVTKEKFEQLNEALFKKTIDIVEKALREAKGGSGVKKEEIEDIVLVGGSTRIPNVRDLLTEYFEGKALNVSIPADTAVAYGAAVHAALLNGEQAKGEIDFNKIQDVTPLSLGVAVYDEYEPTVKKLSIIIPKNTQIPTKSKQDYRTSKDNQPSCLVEVYEGEDYIAANNNLLGTFNLDGIPPGKAGKEKIDVTMEVDSMGIVHVEAVIKSTKGSNKITVTENKLRMSTETKKRLLGEANPAA